MSIRIYIIILLIVTISSGCNELFEEDLETGSITIITPVDSLITNSNLQHFYWETSIDDAPCRLQIVNPYFTRIEHFIVDTLVAGNKFETNLAPNSYEWRIRLENSNSHSEYQYYSLFIDSTQNLSNQKLIIIKPNTNQLFTSMDSINLEWNPITGANQYEYILANISSNDIIQEITQNTSLPFPTLMGQGYYNLSVRGQSTFTNTLKTTINFVIDTNPPTTPVIINPVNNMILNSNDISLSWRAPSDEITPEFDSVYFYSDNSAVNTISVQRVDNNILDTTLSTGVYYWKVMRFDEAGFMSAITIPLKFFVQ